mmetsp:Transcript_17918/g.32266  ORF Transcript_17918/g.32266 Transcript_17918/m.32266 type:complete len:84 (-) Transcript_17918:26-277(-)
MKHSRDEDLASNWVRNHKTRLPSIGRKAHVISFEDNLSKIFELSLSLNKSLTKPSFLHNLRNSLPKLKVLRGREQATKMLSHE